jgi:hypothetical protein
MTRQMRLRLSLALVLACTLTACFEPYKKSDAEARKPLRNAAADTSFQSFLGRLRTAVHKKDVPMIASLMTADFGYTWDESAPPGAQIFSYWDDHQLWPVLTELLDKKFAPQDLYMVSPPELASDSAYAGPRCGMRVERGSWRFAYFLPAGQQ